MTATILIAVFMLGGFVLSVYLRRFAARAVVTFVQIAFAAYLVSAAAKAWVNEDRVLAHATLALVSLAAVGANLCRRPRRERRN